MNNNEIRNGKVLDTFDWYDGPLNYSFQGLSGQLYYATYIGDTNNTPIYLYMPASPDEIKQLITGNIDIHDFHMTQSKNNTFVEIGNSIQQYTQSSLFKKYPPVNWSPDPGVRFGQ